MEHYNVDDLSCLLSQHGYEKPELPPEELATLLKAADSAETTTTTTAGITTSVALSLLHIFQSELKRLEISDWSEQVFCSSDGFLLALTDPASSPNDARDFIRLPDVIANASQGKTDLQPWYKRIVRTVLLYRSLLASSTSSTCCASLSTLAAMVEVLCINYSSVDSVMQDFFSDCSGFPLADTKAHLGAVIEQIPKSRQEFVIKPMIRMARSSVDLETVLGRSLPRTCQETFQRLLFSRLVLPASAYPRLLRYLSRCLSPSTGMLQLLDKSLTLWGDPVIARAYVAGEIMHCTKVSTIAFLYCDRTELLRYKSRVIEKLVRGMPNHFNSADGRTVMLAKFFSEILTESLKHYEDGGHVLNPELANPTDPLCLELMKELQSCEDAAEEFWFMPLPTTVLTEKSDASSSSSTTAAQAPSSATTLESDDDDDDDLEPIESIEPPAKCDIRYIRNFLERLPEMKTHAEITLAFRAIPEIVKQQLAFDHSQMGADLLDQIFLWENEFDDARLDEQRKVSLSAILTTRLDGNLEHFCRMFHRDHVQPYRKSLILDVLFKVARGSSLKDLQSICDASFRLLLVNKDSIDRQDVTVRIPFVLYFARILCLMPEQMLREDQVSSYLGALSSLGAPVDSATEQTVRYAISNVMAALGDKKMSAGVQESIRDARDWLVAIESNR